MTGIVIAFLSGCLIAAWTPGLGAAALSAGAPAVGFVAIACRVGRSGRCWLYWTLAMLAGLGWFHLEMVRYDSLRWTDVGRDPGVVTGQVVGLPRSTADGARFRLRGGDCADCLPVRGRILLLTWPGGPPLRPGDRLVLRTRLKPPRSLLNPGTFDFETWSVSTGVHGTGYVLAGIREGRAGGALDALRDLLARRLAGEGAGARSLLPALAVGDRRWLSDSQREVFQLTGTSHLLAISGLHVGLVAALGGFLAAWLTRIPGLARRLPPRLVLAAVGAWVPAVLYAVLAGFALPTQRALAMLSIWVLSVLMRRRIGRFEGLALALAAALAVAPGSLLGAGFWLSFGAVAGLLAFGTRGRAAWWRSQYVVFVALVPCLVAWSLPVTPLAPWINLLAIPYLGILVLPPLLAGTAMTVVFGGDAGLLWLSEKALAGLVAALTHIADLEWLVHPARAPDAGLAALVFGAALLLWSGSTAALRRAGALTLAMAALYVVEPPRPEVPEVHVLDVGQGLAVLVRTPNHAMLYDTGPRSRGTWDAGAAVVVPYLRGLGLDRLDLVVVSHGDSDHSGGMDSIARGLGVDRWLGSDSSLPTGRCLAGATWTWDDVEFRVLHPTPGLPYLGNDSSCVILVRHGRTRFLLSGDISEVVEARLARTIPSVDGLLVPHHGSKSSSSGPWLAALRPGLALASAGYGNRFGMPTPEVRERHRRAGALLLGTIECGRIVLILDPERGLGWRSAARLDQRRPWRPETACRAPKTAWIKTSIMAGFRDPGD